MRKVIGVVPACDLFDPEKNTMADLYMLGNNYVKRVSDAGCIPIGVAPVDGWVSEDMLNLCDGFIVQGGKDYSPYQFQVIHHAVMHKKRYLGICLGEQLIYAYFALKKMVEERGYDGDLPHAIWAFLEEQGPSFSVLKPVPGHYGTGMVRGGEDAVKHDVSIVPGTILHRLLGRETMRAASFHYLRIPSDQQLVKVNAWASNAESVVEGVEYADHILGIQSHPEVDNLLPEIFRFLAE